MIINLFMYLADVRHLGFSAFFAMTDNVAMKQCVQVLVWTYVSTSLENILMTTVAGSYGSSMFSLLRNY